MATLGVVGGGGGRAAPASKCGRRGGDVATSTSPSSPSPPYQSRDGADHRDIDTSIPSYHSSSSSTDGPTANPHSPNPATAPLLFSTASAARWRRKGGSLSNIDVNQHQHSKPAKSSPRHRAASVHVRPIEGMEEVHGVDVSWLHRPNKDHRPRRPHTQSTPDVKKDVRDGNPPPSDHDADAKRPQVSTSDSKVPSFPNVTPPTPVEPTKDTTPAYSSPSPQAPSKLSEPKRPGLFSRGSNEKVPQEKPSKRTSWMTRISSKKLDSQAPPARPASTPMQPPKQTPSTPPTPNGLSNESAAAIAAETVGSPPLKQKDSSFFSSLKRTLSANSQTGGIPKMPGQGAPCARRVLNIDPNRERCNVPEMDSSRLRRVSFCVDVEIAGGPKYADEDDEDDKKSKKKDFKAKERAEGEALKHPEAIKEEKEKEGEAVMENKVASNGLGPRDSTEDVSGSPDADGNDGDRDSAARKREKKKQSEIERKERKEKRRRRAEESGAIPVELPLDGDAGVSKAAAPANGAAPKGAANGTATAPKTPTQPQPHANSKQDRPTTDPVRIYRRCCQLRESPILKRITEQLMNPKCMQPDEPGVVHCLDLTGSRLQLADVVSLGDWLAVVPVKDLKLEDADLSDEGVRCILAGLLAAKRPGPTKRKSLTPRHREGIPFEPYQERSGVIEKITLKNNPRLTRVGWKHISLFLYMCRSLRAIDLSMNFFPETLPPSAQVTPIKSSQNNAPNGKPEELDAAEALYQCLSERLGGQKLEELIMSECGLSSAQIRKVVDGVMAVQVKRLGLAGNHLDDEGLEYVLEYVRSGMCQALDLGANDLRGKLGLIGEAIVATVREDRPCWGLCLAGCNLDTASLKPLLAQLVKLPSFKFMDLSHNPNLGSDDDSLMPLLGRYLGQLPEFKRLHLTDVNMSPSQAISLANILPECPLAHLNILENPQLTALANATTEADQEEACALYASLMAAVRVSGTLMCIDVDVPSAENSDIVKALAKQVVAYSLRNMETFAISEVTGAAPSMANATAALTAQHGGEKGVKEFAVPDVLMSLVGHVDGVPENHDHDDPAPDEDYIVGGTGVVKALQYVLGGERMTSTMSPTTTGANTPTRPTSSGGLVEPGKAKKMSKNLLSSARKIRDRLQPALMKESAAGGDEVQYRRLMFLDQTLQNIIERFEEEYPETRLAPPSPKPAASVRSSYTDQSTASASATTQATDVGTTGSEDDEEVLSGGDDEDRFDNTHLHHTSRQNSEVNIISRQQTREEGHLHRLGQKLRRDVLETPTSIDFQDVPWRRREEDERFRKVAEKIEDLDGRELRHLVTTNGWDEAIKKLGANVGDLRHLQEEDPEAWELFKESQEKAILNRTGSVAQ